MKTFSCRNTLRISKKNGEIGAQKTRKAPQAGVLTLAKGNAVCTASSKPVQTAKQKTRARLFR